jgi:hypothetical protein
MSRSIAAIGILALLAGCGRSTTTTAPRSGATGAAISRVAPGPLAGQPGYEPAYVNGQTVTINAIEVPNHAPTQAQADFYETVYPIGWQQMGLAPPQCNPCDHDHNGIDPEDFHDHILDSMPDTGHGEYHPLWHVNVVVPAYQEGNDAHNQAVGQAYATHIPTKSEAEVNALLAAKMPDGSPVAVKIDTHFYFLCAVVNAQAAK